MCLNLLTLQMPFMQVYMILVRDLIFMRYNSVLSSISACTTSPSLHGQWTILIWLLSSTEPVFSRGHDAFCPNSSFSFLCFLSIKHNALLR